MHHASSDVIGSQGVESQSHHSMHDVYLQFPLYFTTIVRAKTTFMKWVVGERTAISRDSHNENSRRQII